MPDKIKADQKKPKDASAIELEPDAWKRFEKAVGKVVPPKKPQRKQTNAAGKEK